MSVLSVQLPSQFSAATYRPALDVAANVSANIVSGEVQTIAANQGTDAQVIFPTYAPFYTDGLVIQLTLPNGTVRSLTLDVDYKLAYPFISAIRSTGKLVYGGIVLLDNTLVGNVSLSYRTLGGTWIYNTDLQTSNLFATTNPPYVTSWEQFANYQSVFPIVTVAWDKPDNASIESLGNAVLALCDALTSQYKNEAVLQLAISVLEM
jgi:hypothetical protein